MANKIYENLYEYNYDMPETSGIYLIRNRVNNKGYVGQAQFLPNRAVFFYHEHCIPLERAYEKYGMENFDILLLEECDPSVLNEREIYWIAALHTWVGDSECQGYNLTQGGRDVTGFRHSEETSKKMSEVHSHISEETRRKMRESSRHLSGKDHPMYNKGYLVSGEKNGMYGKHHSDTFRKERSSQYKGEGNPFYGKHHTPETIDKIKTNMPDFSGENNPFYGHSHTESTKSLIRESREKYKGEHHPWYGREHRESTKQFLSEYNKGKIYVNNGEIMKFVKSQEEVDHYLSLGWTRGRLKGCTKKNQPNLLLDCVSPNE